MKTEKLGHSHEKDTLKFFSSWAESQKSEPHTQVV